MIKINFNPEIEPQIPIKHISNDSIVGVEYNSGNKGIIVMMDEIVYVCYNNGEPIPAKFVDSKYQYLTCYESNINNAYVFNTVKECFKWMSE